jgi:hypothetical protein
MKRVVEPEAGILAHRCCLCECEFRKRWRPQCYDTTITRPICESGQEKTLPVTMLATNYDAKARTNRSGLRVLFWYRSNRDTRVSGGVAASGKCPARPLGSTPRLK